VSVSVMVTISGYHSGHAKKTYQH